MIILISVKTIALHKYYVYIMYLYYKQIKKDIMFENQYKSFILSIILILPLSFPLMIIESIIILFVIFNIF